MSNTTGHDHDHDHSNHEDHSHSHSATDAHGHGAAAGDIAECPVMAGTPVNKAQAEAAGLFRDYKGQRYWFCCAACAPMWDADPDEYAAA